MTEGNYRIMLVAAEKNNTSLYKYMLNTDGTIYEAMDGFDDAGSPKTASAFLEEKVEEMLNSGKYAKSDFIIVKQFDYEVETNIYT